MEGINSFEKGLHRSNSPQEQPEGSYVDALNWIRNDSGRLINEELEELVQTLPNYILVGYTPINDEFICFFQVGTNSEIGIFNKNKSPNYAPVFNDINHPSYKLNFGSSIDCVARIVSLATNPATSGDLVVYFVEENNPMRRFNISEYISNPNIYNTIEDFNLLLEYKMPYCTLDIIQDGGGLSSGVYSIVLRYRTNENNKTICNIPTKFLSIIDENPANNPGPWTGKYSDFFDGCPPGTLTTKSIKITIKHVDENYPYIEPIIITYTGVANNLVIKSLGIYENTENNEILFSSLQQLRDDVPTTEISENAFFYESAECIEQKDNVLVLSNLTSKKYDDAFQKLANDIELYWEIEEVIVYSPRAITSFNEKYFGGAFDFDYVRKIRNNGLDFTPQTVKDTTDLWQSNIYQEPTTKKGFQRGEVYSFSITPIFKDGSLGFAYHIPGKIDNGTKRLKAWVSSNDYPEYMKQYNINPSNKIQHHKMPDFDEALRPLGRHIYDSDNKYLRSVINVLRVRAKNIDLTKYNLKGTIQGYIIGYQQRTNDTNTRIIDYGFIRPYFQYERGGGTQSPRYRNAFFNGNGRYLTNEKGWSSQEAIAFNSPYYMYHSVDTTFLNREIKSSYFLEKIGDAFNEVPNYNGYGSNNPLPPRTYKPPQTIAGPEYPTGVYKSRLPLLIYKTNDTDAKKQMRLFFEEGNFYVDKTPAKQIENAQYVPNIYEVNGVGRIGTDISLNQCNSFWHIKTAGGGVLSTASKYYYNQLLVSQKQGTTLGDFTEIINLETFILNIARITNPIDFQYGPLNSAEYAPLLTRFDDENLDILNADFLELEGDTYVCKTFMRRCDNFISDGENVNATGGEGYYAEMLIGFYCESRNNLALRYKEANGAEYYPKNRVIYSTDPNDTGIMNRNLDTITFPYNKQYSAVNNVKVSVTIPDFFKEVTKFPNRSIYSLTAFESNIVDRYRIFPSNQFHDIPKDRGVITDTFVFNNTFFHHTEYGLWQSFFNPNTIQSTSQGDVVLGNAGIFRIPSKPIIDIKGGYMGTLDKSGTNTPFGRVFLDHHQGKIFLFAGEAPVEISDLGLFSFFREFVNTKDKYNMGYDWANKRLLISNITQEKAISFYPKTQTWTSLHEFAPTAYLTLNGSSYAWQDTGTSFYNLSNSNDRRKNSYITFVENTQPDAFKRFDRIEMNTMSGGSGGIVNPGSIPDATNYTFNNNSFTHIHTWTDRQNSTELVFAYSNDYNTNFLNSYDPSKVPVNYYRSSFHAELPLDAVVDPNKNIFDDRLLPQGNLDINTDFRTHMKGKFLYTKLSYKNIGNTIVDKPLVLNYVKTFFKPTVA